ncbi:Spo0E family sporulation regulatory protein-aspartic acid phosphatase [Clostridium formicaceticum]|uniref:Uncharacterized protein n=1 Tax=Clostridium formicaceticum TaxID=1497 RepID=A0AAC9RJ89_9CLOT|nr:Spo0E family sporulation regulatory protein-aspartic acid phosphatase [Clostridium formicaceticum]ARE86522.1 hypothetical protein CLFO_08440 [Clostridium formicaceticum]
MNNNKIELEVLRKQLNDALAENGGKVTKDIIKTSQQLDRIIETYLCSQKESDT